MAIDIMTSSVRARAGISKEAPFNSLSSLSTVKSPPAVGKMVEEVSTVTGTSSLSIGGGVVVGADGSFPT